MAASHTSASHWNSSSCDLWQSLQMIVVSLSSSKNQDKKWDLEKIILTLQWQFSVLVAVVIFLSWHMCGQKDGHTRVSTHSSNPEALPLISGLFSFDTNTGHTPFNRGFSCSHGFQSTAVTSTGSKLPLYPLKAFKNYYSGCLSFAWEISCFFLPLSHSFFIIWLAQVD